MKKKLIDLSWGHRRLPQKTGPDRFSRFDVYSINKQKQISLNVFYSLDVY